MAIMPHDREYDLVVYGATGYTGKLVSEHVARHLPTTLSWALAGRNAGKLHEVAASLAPVNRDRAAPRIEVVADPAAALGPLAARTRVLIAVVGPYLAHGEHALDACVRHGTHYLDVSGETVFLGRMIAKHAAQAAASGSVAVSQAGLESVPADMLTYALARFARQEFGPRAELGHVAMSLDMNDSFSGGSLASVLELFGNVPLRELRDTHRPFALSPVVNDRPPSNKYALPRLLGVRRIPGLGLQTASVFGTADAAVVGRSWGLMQVLSGSGGGGGGGGPDSSESEHLRKNMDEDHNDDDDDGTVQNLAPYGQHFSFGETAPCRSWAGGVAYYYAFSAVMLLIAVSSWFRALVRMVATKLGSGMSKEAMEKSRARFRAVGEVVVGKGVGGGRTVVAQARYSGSAYQWTGAFVAQAAMVLLESESPLPGGILTPACLGQAYVDRLASVGFKIEVTAE